MRKIIALIEKIPNEKQVFKFVEMVVERIGNLIGDLVKFAIWLFLFFAVILIAGAMAVAPIILIVKLFR